MPYLTLPFLQGKIKVLENAFFFPVMHSVLNIPVRIVKALEVDELGQIWFTIPHPAQYIAEFDKEFLAKLDFFKKGINFYLKIAGTAFVVTDPEEINSLCLLSEELKQTARKNEIVLLKVKIQYADYFKNAPKLSTSRKTNLPTSIYKWFLKQPPGNGLFPKRSGPILLEGMARFPNNFTN